MFRRLFNHLLLHSCLVVLAADVAGDLGSTTGVGPLCLTLEGGAKVDEAAIAIPRHATDLAPIVLVTCVIDSRDSIRHLALFRGGLSLTLSLRVEVIALLDGKGSPGCLLRQLVDTDDSLALRGSRRWVRLACLGRGPSLGTAASCLRVRASL